MFRAIQRKYNTALQEDSRTKELDLLIRVKKLIEDKIYDLALLECYKIIELALKQAIILAYGIAKENNLNDLIIRASQLNLLTIIDIERLTEIRIERNKAAHTDQKTTKAQAIRALSTTKRIIKTVSFTTNISGFNWLRVNRDEALKSLRGENKKLLERTIHHLWDAWVHRDGAISGEISEFFAESLKTNPNHIIKMFLKDKTQFDMWLNKLSTQLFTDYTGKQHAELTQLRSDILLNLTHYIKNSRNLKYRNTAKKIKDKIETISVRIVD